MSSGTRVRQNDDRAAAEPAPKRPRATPDVSYIRDFGDHEALAFLDQLASKWRLEASHATDTFEERTRLAFQNFDADVLDDMGGSVTTDPGSYGLRDLDEHIQECELEAFTLYHRMHELGLLPEQGSDDRDKHATLRLLLKVLGQVFYAKKQVLCAFQAKLDHRQLHAEPGALELDQDLDARLGEWALRFRYIDGEMTPYQSLLLYLLDAAMEKRYRKLDESLYEPIIVDGHDTHAWKRVMEIEDFVYSMLRKETCIDQWKNATASSKNAPDAIKYLTKCHDHQLPTLDRQRAVYSFRNGVYEAAEDRFYTFGVDSVPGRLTACKFFDAEFAPADGDWRDIPTPALDTIPRCQEWPAEVVDWYFIFLGRMLYPIGAHDKWQVAPFFRGLASTGKSTSLIKVMKQFFDPVDVGILSNNIEDKFGLSAFSDKYIVLGPEVRNDLAINQAEYQQIVSGEDTVINTKHKKATSCVWTAPLAFAGNEVPSWADAGGAISRRTVVFEFLVMITHTDTDLDDKLLAEMPNIIQKANKAYLEMARRHPSTNVWDILPDYFKGTRDSLAESTSSIVGFLRSPDITFGPDEYCSFDDFKAALKEYEVSNSIRSRKYDRDAFLAPFSKYKLKFARDKRMYNGMLRHKDWVLGVSLHANAENPLG